MKAAAVSLVCHPDIVHAGLLLVVWNKRYGGWAFPGGLVEEGETLEQGQARELFEETGLRTDRAELLYDAPVAAELATGRGQHVYVYRVTPVWMTEERTGPNSILRQEFKPYEQVLGCPVTWLTRNEFLLWSPFAPFYREMFAKGVQP